MATPEEKRPHVATERMQEFKKTNCKDVTNGCHKVLKCPHPGCSKVLTSLPGLRYHIKTHLGMEATFACSKCKKCFKSANGLKYHTEKTRCEDCSTASLVAESESPYANGFSQRLHRNSTDAEEDEYVDVLEPPPPAGSLPALDVSTSPSPWDAKLSSAGFPSDCAVLSPTPYKTALCLQKQEEIASPLAQLAFIATGPQSPLIDAAAADGAWHRGDGRGAGSSSDCTVLNGTAASWHEQLSPTMAIHSYAKPSCLQQRHPPVTWKRSLSFSTPTLCQDGNGAGSSSSSEDDAKGRLISRSASNGYVVSSDWPVASWLCFLSGTRVRVDNGHASDWKVVRQRGWKAPAGFSAPHGLRLSRITSVHGPAADDGLGGSARTCALTIEASRRKAQSSLVLLHFLPAAADDDSSLFSMSPPLPALRHPAPIGLWAECARDHPFFVKEKGWCSCSPSQSEERYRLACLELDVNDVCLPPLHPDAAFTLEALHSFETYDFTPEESSAVFALSSLAKLRRSDQEHDDGSPLSQSYPLSPLRNRHDADASLLKAKRPMNAFMLFAKKFRIEYTQMYPGKDNRAISVLLGDRWKKMRNEERRGFALEAKALAEQHKRLNPDCWKRKRSASESCLP